MSKTTVDRRATPRVDTKVSIQASPEEGGVVARMVTQNLSLDGLYCTSTSDYPEMTRLAVRLLLPHHSGNLGPEPVDLEAVVVRREELHSSTGEARFKLALFFTNMKDGVRERIAQYLR